MHLSLVAMTAGFIASTVAHPYQQEKHHHPKVLDGIIDEEIVVVPTHEDMITPANHKHHGHHHEHKHHENKHHESKHHGSSSTPPIVVKNADGSVTVIPVTEGENHHHHGQKHHEHKHHGGGSSSLDEELENVESGSGHKHHNGGSSSLDEELESVESSSGHKHHEHHHGHKHHDGGSSSLDEEVAYVLSGSTGSNHGSRLNAKAGKSPDQPVYVDIATSLAAEPPLFPANTFLTRREIEIFHDLTKGIVQSQKVLSECIPKQKHVCQKSIELWEKLSELVPNYKVLRQVQYIEACNALRTSLETLSTEPHKLRDAKLQSVLWKLLLDNLLLAGYLDDVYEGTIIPNFNLDPPGEVIGALIHFIGIDVTKALNFWPSFAPHVHHHKTVSIVE